MVIFLFKEVLVCYEVSNLVCGLVSEKFVFQDKEDIEISSCKRVTYRIVGGCALAEILSINQMYGMALLQLGAKFSKPFQWIQLHLLWTLWILLFSKALFILIIWTYKIISSLSFIRTRLQINSVHRHVFFDTTKHLTYQKIIVFGNSSQ